MTHEFRPGFEFDVPRLQSWLAVHAPEVEGPLQVSQFSGGQSNPTYLLQGPARSYVLRRKPPGVLVASAHAIEREYRVMRALGEHSRVPVARTVALCADVAVVGTAFYVMEHVAGRIFWDPSLPDVPTAGRAALFDGMNAAIASLHGVVPAVAGLEDFGRADGYIARQILRWSRQYAADEDVAGRIEAMDRLIEWLVQHAPAEQPAGAVVHGDFRIDNLIFHPTEPRVLAILDWELSTIGDPYADFAYHLMMYRLRIEAIPGLAGCDLHSLGVPDESAYTQAYCRRRGLAEIPNLAFYKAFCLFRLAGIFHGIRARVARGTAVSAQARRYAVEVESLAQQGWQQAQAG